MRVSYETGCWMSLFTPSNILAVFITWNWDALRRFEKRWSEHSQWWSSSRVWSLNNEISSTLSSQISWRFIILRDELMVRYRFCFVFTFNRFVIDQSFICWILLGFSQRFKRTLSKYFCSLSNDHFLKHGFQQHLLFRKFYNLERCLCNQMMPICAEKLLLTLLSKVNFLLLKIFPPFETSKKMKLNIIWLPFNHVIRKLSVYLLSLFML